MVLSSRTRGGVVWLSVAALLTTMTLFSLFGPLADHQWEEPQLLFALLTAAAAVSILAATLVIGLADRWEMAEIGLLGTVLIAASILPLVHGLMTPGVLFSEVTPAFRTASFLALPIAIAVGSPLLVPRSGFGRWAARHWRDWTLLALTGVFMIASAIVFFPEAVVMPGPTAVSTIVITVLVAAAFVSLSMRQLQFYGLGQHPANMVASLSMLLLAVMALTPLAPERFGLASWWTHVAGVLGVVGACSGLVVSKRMSSSGNDIFRPLLTRDPLSAFELGLSPIVHAFISDLDGKDGITRDHVIRTGELAIRVGERMRLSSSELRQLGLAAMLHDVGKLRVPDEILMKPERLTEDEYSVMKLHPVDGETMLRSEPTLAAAADIVRSHHERWDGGGYPDGLAGEQIPLASRIIAVCDAVDAMTHDRPYRKAMPIPMAFAILREHAGTQWDENVVRNVMAVLPEMAQGAALDAVGRLDPDDVVIPDDISELLVEVDAEI